MSFWVKRFTDGSQEKGTDEDIEKRLATWSKGKLENIESVLLVHKMGSLELIGEGSYWHQDCYEALPFAPSIRVARRIMKQIEPSDKSFRVCKVGSLLKVMFDAPLSFGGEFYCLEEYTGKWLTLEIHTLSGSVRHYLKESL